MIEGKSMLQIISARQSDRKYSSREVEHEKHVRRLLGIPGSKRVELIITIGYSEAEQRPKKRKPKEEVVRYNKY